MKLGFGVDVGGTTTKIGLVNEIGQLLRQREIATCWREGRDAVFEDIAENVREIAASEGVPLEICSVGIGVAGPVEASGYVEAIVNLDMYDLFPAKELSDKLGGVPVVVANDANVAALGELWRGGGKGYDSLILITLGTGVGSGIIVDRKIVYGAHGLGGEIGHIWVNPSEPETCNCGGHGCLDQMASATGIVRNAHRFLDREKYVASKLREIPDFTAKDVIDSAKLGDAIAAKTLKYCMGFLGKMIADVTYVIDPDVVVIGGGISKAGDYILKLIYDLYKPYPCLKKCRTEFALATLGGDAGMYGAAYLALQK